jgi:hypothetical protein
MHIAIADLFRAKWTDAIHDEWTGNVLKDRPDLKPEQLARTRSLMNAHVRNCLVTGYEELIPTLSLPDPGDRHVLAAAIHCGADVIVTFNLRDFHRERLAVYGIVAQHPDEFLRGQLRFAKSEFCAAVQRHRASLRNPTKNVEEYLATLAQQGLVRTVEALRKFAKLI